MAKAAVDRVKDDEQQPRTVVAVRLRSGWVPDISRLYNEKAECHLNADSEGEKNWDIEALAGAPGCMVKPLAEVRKRMCAGQS